MNGSGRDDAPFSGRVWQEIDQTIASVRAANCTARRFLEVDGPYGLGLTSVAGDERWLQPLDVGAKPDDWNVRRARTPADPGEPPSGLGGGTYLVSGGARPVPLIASEFLLGMRALEAYDAGCQPLDLCSATKAARDVALEEERLIYYGSGDPGSQALLDTGDRNVTPLQEPPKEGPEETPSSERREGRLLINALHEAIEELAGRGYAGPFALAVDAGLYTDIYAPNYGEDTLRVDLIRNLFRGGIHMVPVIAKPDARRGVIVTLGRAYSRLVVGQDWYTCYRGRDGVLHRFLITSSLQLRICDARSIQVLVREGWTRPQPNITPEQPNATPAQPNITPAQPDITGYLSTSGQTIPEAAAGTPIVIAGSNLGSPGDVTFDVKGRRPVGAQYICCWSPSAIVVIVPSMGTKPVEASVTVTPEGGQPATGPNLPIVP